MKGSLFESFQGESVRDHGASSRVAVVGAGLQGVALALELSKRGGNVDLLEARDDCLTQASLNNEGKIHLGYTYAADLSLETARLMSIAACRFEPLFREWLEMSPDFDLSDPFFYVVDRRSLYSAETLERRYRQIAEINGHCLEQSGGSYLGQTSVAAPERLSGAEAETICDPAEAEAVYRTAELAANPYQLMPQLRERVSQDRRITLQLRHRVQAVRHSPCEAEALVRVDGKARWLRYDHVVNATWEDLVRLDATAGVAPLAPWSYRIKYFLSGRNADPGGWRSVSIVLGPFGDVVQFAGGQLYLSWYPVGRRVWSESATLPPEASALEESATDEISEGIYRGLQRYFPQMLGDSRRETLSLELRGGVIFALGKSDIDCRSSGLHQRSKSGPRSFGRYHTVDSGKLTTAPYFAEALARRILQE